MRDGTFLQSEAWERFQQQVGRTTHRVADVLVIEQTAPLGTYWYIGRVRLDTEQLLPIIRAAKQAGVLFVRIDPVVEIPNTKYHIQETASTQPQTTVVLDLTPTAKQLLDSFHEKTRYNIRLAERKGVTIRESSDPAGPDFQAFITLGRRTGRHQGIRLHDEAYYRLMLKALGRNPILARHSESSDEESRYSLDRQADPKSERRSIWSGKQTWDPSTGLPAETGQRRTQDDGTEPGEISTSIVVAYLGDTPLAANLMLWSGQTAYYLHGASDHTYRNLMAPHLLQWACIQAAKERGAHAYDFWGIASSLSRRPERSEAELKDPDGNKPILRQAQDLQDSSTPGSPDDVSGAQNDTYSVDPSHPWAGLTRFKLGFGGRIVRYPDSVDVVLNPVRYRLYQAARTVRRALNRVVG